MNINFFMHKYLRLNDIYNIQSIFPFLEKDFDLAAIMFNCGSCVTLTLLMLMTFDKRFGI